MCYCNEYKTNSIFSKNSRTSESGRDPTFKGARKSGRMGPNSSRTPDKILSHGLCRKYAQCTQNNPKLIQNQSEYDTNGEFSPDENVLFVATQCKAC